jgi:uncharacterized protein YneR
LKINNSKHTTVYQEEFKIPKGGNQNLYIKEEQTSAADRGFDTRLVQNKECKIGICYFSAKHASLRRKSKDLLA